jgi:hypothetical protein
MAWQDTELTEQAGRNEFLYASTEKGPLRGNEIKKESVRVSHQLCLLVNQAIAGSPAASPPKQPVEENIVSQAVQKGPGARRAKHVPAKAGIPRHT